MNISRQRKIMNSHTCIFAMTWLHRLYLNSILIEPARLPFNPSFINRRCSVVAMRVPVGETAARSSQTATPQCSSPRRTSASTKSATRPRHSGAAADGVRSSESTVLSLLLSFRNTSNALFLVTLLAVGAISTSLCRAWAFVLLVPLPL